MSEKLPSWYRALQIILGVAAIILAVMVWLYYSVAITVMIILFSFALMILGISGIVSGASGSGLPSWRRVLDLLLGVLSIFVAVLVIIFPSSGISLLIILLGIGLLFNGLLGIASGATNADFPGWQRALYLIFGVILVIFSIYILLQPTIGTVVWLGVLPIPGTLIPLVGFYYVIPSTGYLLLVLFLSVGLIIRGIQAIVSGARGTE